MAIQIGCLIIFNYCKLLIILKFRYVFISTLHSKCISSGFEEVWRRFEDSPGEVLLFKYKESKVRNTFILRTENHIRQADKPESQCSGSTINLSTWQPDSQNYIKARTTDAHVQPQYITLSTPLKKKNFISCQAISCHSNIIRAKTFDFANSDWKSGPVQLIAILGR